MTDTAKELDFLTERMSLSSLLSTLRERYGGYKLLEHWKQGEFHHDVVLRVGTPGPDIPGDVLVVATNCNGGIKELLCFDKTPQRWAIWHFRCPEVPEFAGEIPAILGKTRTANWYDPCGLLGENGPSELKPEFRERMRGGGWCLADPAKPHED
jgi:hypothetical protein